MTASRTCVPHLQVQFVLDDNFKLDDLLKLELHKFADEVGEIVDCAQKEEKMEQGLAKLKVVSWVCLKKPACTGRLPHSHHYEFESNLKTCRARTFCSCFTFAAFCLAT